MQRAIEACWCILGAIHVVPALALVRPSLLTKLYGIESGSTASVLIHHRAALFLGIVVLCGWSVWDPACRQASSVVVGLSMLSFLALYVRGGAPRVLRTIAVMDLLGLPALALVGVQAFH